MEDAEADKFCFAQGLTVRDLLSAQNDKQRGTT